MAWDEGNIVSVILKQRYLNQEIINKLTYKIINKGVSAVVDDLLQAVLTVIVDKLTPLQHEDLTHYEIRMDDLTDGVSFASLGIVRQGLIVGNTCPSYVAGGFTKSVGSKVTRPGGMRLAGIPEADTTGNDWNPSPAALLDAVTALEENLVATPAPGANWDLQPVVVRQLTPAPAATFIENPVTNVLARTLLSSQVSRKAGVGE